MFLSLNVIYSIIHPRPVIDVPPSKPDRIYRSSKAIQLANLDNAEHTYIIQTSFSTPIRRGRSESIKSLMTPTRRSRSRSCSRKRNTTCCSGTDCPGYSTYPNLQDFGVINDTHTTPRTPGHSRMRHSATVPIGGSSKADASSSQTSLRTPRSTSSRRSLRRRPERIESLPPLPPLPLHLLSPEPSVPVSPECAPHALPSSVSVSPQAPQRVPVANVSNDLFELELSPIMENTTGFGNTVRYSLGLAMDQDEEDLASAPAVFRNLSDDRDNDHKTDSCAGFEGLFTLKNNNNNNNNNNKSSSDNGGLLPALTLTSPTPRMDSEGDAFTTTATANDSALELPSQESSLRWMTVDEHEDTLASTHESEKSTSASSLAGRIFGSMIRSTTKRRTRTRDHSWEHVTDGDTADLSTAAADENGVLRDRRHSVVVAADPEETVGKRGRGRGWFRKPLDTFSDLSTTLRQKPIAQVPSLGKDEKRGAAEADSDGTVVGRMQRTLRL